MLLKRHRLATHVNLIPWNVVADGEFSRPSRGSIQTFQKVRSSQLPPHTHACVSGCAPTRCRSSSQKYRKRIPPNSATSMCVSIPRGDEEGATMPLSGKAQNASHLRRPQQQQQIVGLGLHRCICPVLHSSVVRVLALLPRRLLSVHPTPSPRPYALARC